MAKKIKSSAKSTRDQFHGPRSFGEYLHAETFPLGARCAIQAGLFDMPQNTSDSVQDSSTTSISLLHRVRSQNDGAFERLARLYSPSIYTYCRKAGVDATSAEDVCQEVLVAVSRGIAKFTKESASGSFRGWLYRIVANKIIDHFRRTKKQPIGQGGYDFNQLLNQLPEELSSESIAALPPLHLELRRALELIRSDFDTRTWQAFCGMTVERKTAAEVGEGLGMSAKAVRQAKYRVLQRFRSEFGDLLDF